MVGLSERGTFVEGWKWHESGGRSREVSARKAD